MNYTVPPTLFSTSSHSALKTRPPLRTHLEQSWTDPNPQREQPPNRNSLIEIIQL